MINRLNALWIVIAMGLTACDAPAASVTSTQSASDTLLPPTATLAPTLTSTPEATYTPKPTPSPTAVPELFQLSKSLSGLKSVGLWDSQYRDPGAIIFHDGQYHMFYNGINGFPRPVGVGYAISDDGLHWTTQSKEPVFNLGLMTHPGLYYGPNLFVTSGLVLEDGTWVLYYYTIAGESFDGTQAIGRATAPSPFGPWTPDPNPVLLPGPSGAWDDRQLGSPNVIQTSDGFVMYYDAKGNASMIGMATSPDGEVWTKYNDPATTDALYAESDPILTPDAGSWDAKRVMDPNVVQTDDGWAMIYLTADGTQKFNGKTYAFGFASSSDGIHWAKSSRNPVLSSIFHPRWAGIYLSTLLYDQGTYRLYFDLAAGDGTSTNIQLATFDGVMIP